MQTNVAFRIASVLLNCIAQGVCSWVSTVHHSELAVVQVLQLTCVLATGPRIWCCRLTNFSVFGMSVGILIHWLNVTYCRFGIISENSFLLNSGQHCISVVMYVDIEFCTFVTIVVALNLT